MRGAKAWSLLPSEDCSRTTQLRNRVWVFTMVLAPGLELHTASCSASTLRTQHSTYASP